MPLRLDVIDAALSVVEMATENKEHAIEDITNNHGIDPQEAALIGGGGAAGFNSVFIARRLGSPLLIMPETGAALSAAGALMSELRDEHREMFFVRSSHFDAAAVNEVLGRLQTKCERFIEGAGSGSDAASIEFSVEARYAGQVWEIEIPLRESRFGQASDLDDLVQDFHAMHQEIFAVRDENSVVEFVGWVATATASLREERIGRLKQVNAVQGSAKHRRAHFREVGFVDTPVVTMSELLLDEDRLGPALVETAFTTIVIDPKARFRLSKSGSLLITP
jgi:N-methylhydantoinase A